MFFSVFAKEFLLTNKGKAPSGRNAHHHQEKSLVEGEVWGKKVGGSTQQDAFRLSVDISLSLLSASAFQSLGYAEAQRHLCASYSKCMEPTSLSLILSATSQEKGAH